MGNTFISTFRGTNLSLLKLIIKKLSIFMIKTVSITKNVYLVESVYPANRLKSANPAKFISASHCIYGIFEAGLSLRKTK